MTVQQRGGIWNFVSLASKNDRSLRSRIRGKGLGAPRNSPFTQSPRLLAIPRSQEFNIEIFRRSSRLANRLVRTRMLGGVRGLGLAAPSYSIVECPRKLKFLSLAFSLEIRIGAWCAYKIEKRVCTMMQQNSIFGDIVL